MQQQCQRYPKWMFTESFGFVSLRTGSPDCEQTQILDTG